jgi:hypothetical protein
MFDASKVTVRHEPPAGEQGNGTGDSGHGTPQPTVPACAKAWADKAGNIHECILKPGHGLICACDCGERKLMGLEPCEAVRKLTNA